MNVAEWILVAILSLTLFIFLIVAIILVVKLFALVDEAKKVVEKGQDIADGAEGIVDNVRGFTSVGGVVQTFVDDYVAPKFKEKVKGKERKKANDGRKKAKK